MILYVDLVEADLAGVVVVGVLDHLDVVLGDTVGELERADADRVGAEVGVAFGLQRGRRHDHAGPVGEDRASAA